KISGSAADNDYAVRKIKLHNKSSSKSIIRLNQYSTDGFRIPVVVCKAQNCKLETIANAAWRGFYFWYKIALAFRRSKKKENRIANDKRQSNFGNFMYALF
ncbi:MAG: hypothetical protein AAB401_01110, partial [Acidobacteriota bacterium]